MCASAAGHVPNARNLNRKLRVEIMILIPMLVGLLIITLILRTITLAVIGFKVFKFLFSWGWGIALLIYVFHNQ
jgi:hypothetical protein